MVPRRTPARSPAPLTQLFRTMIVTPGEVAIKATDMRRSCTFCRQRKMRCSGDMPCCSTCRQREKPCVYEPVAFKRNRRFEGPESDTVVVKRELQQAMLLQYQQQYPGSGFPSHHDDFSPQRPTLVVGEELHLFHNTFSAAVHASRIAFDAEQAAAPVLSYADGLTTVTRDLINMTMTQIGTPPGDAAPTYAQSLKLDTSASLVAGISFPEAETWFNVNGPPSATQIEQMLELAFNHHPLAALVVPKTHFMRENSEGSANTCLLWLLCGEGLELGVPPCAPCAPTTFTLPLPQSFVHMACKTLFQARQSSREDGMAVCQATLLLGFRLLCQGRTKQATCFILFSLRSASFVMQERRRMPPAEIKINGMRLSEVEDQALSNVFWIAHALSLWMWTQLSGEDADLAQIIRPDVPFNVATPSTVVSTGALYKLDYVSGNFTSLATHMVNARALGVLAHTCNVVHTFTANSTEADGLQATSTLFAAVSANVLHQSRTGLAATSTTTSAATADQYANTAILAAAHLVAIGVCQAPYHPMRPVTSDELVSRSRVALDVAMGMLRDCRVSEPASTTAAATRETSLIRSYFAIAQRILRQLYSTTYSALQQQQRATSGDDSAASEGNHFAPTPSWMPELLAVVQDIDTFIGTDDGSSSASASSRRINARNASSNFGQVFNRPTPPPAMMYHSMPHLPAPSVASSSATSSTESLRISDVSSFTSHHSWPPMTDGMQHAFRARSYSDSAAIYCATAMHGVPVLPYFSNGMPASSYIPPSYVPPSPDFASFESSDASG